MRRAAHKPVSGFVDQVLARLQVFFPRLAGRTTRRNARYPAPARGANLRPLRHQQRYARAGVPPTSGNEICDVNVAFLLPDFKIIFN